MAKLSDFVTDQRAVNDGAWTRVNESLYDDLEIKTRGFTDQFVDAQAARVKRAMNDANLRDGDPLPNATTRHINASLLKDFLVLDVRNLMNDAGEPVAVDEFHKLLGDPKAARLARACYEAAGKVSATTVKANDVDLGN